MYFIRADMACVTFLAMTRATQHRTTEDLSKTDGAGGMFTVCPPLRQTVRHDADYAGVIDKN